MDAIVTSTSEKVENLIPSEEFIEDTFWELVFYLYALFRLTTHEFYHECPLAMHFTDVCKEEAAKTIPSAIKEWYEQSSYNEKLIWIVPSSQVGSDDMKVLLTQLCKVGLTVAQDAADDWDPSFIQRQFHGLLSKCDHHELESSEGQETEDKCKQNEG